MFLLNFCQDIEITAKQLIAENVWLERESYLLSLSFILLRQKVSSRGIRVRYFIAISLNKDDVKIKENTTQSILSISFFRKCPTTLAHSSIITQQLMRRMGISQLLNQRWLLDNNRRAIRLDILKILWY